MNVYLPFLAVVPLLAAVMFVEADPASTHQLERPPNAPAYTYRQAVIIPAPLPEERAPEPTEPPLPTTAPTVAVPVYVQPKLSPSIDAAIAECRQRADRYDWQGYALAAGFPPDVVAGPEMANVIFTESGGDLCAVNTSSKAACWAQILSSAGIEQQIAYLDPSTCMAAAFAKWRDGGNDFYRHWYQWWVR